VNGLTPCFFPVVELKNSQWRSFKQVFGQDFPDTVRPPRNLMGRDVLDQYAIVLHEGSTLMLTDDHERTRRFLSQAEGTAYPV
jgi:hypothetical protein